jgi:RNA binding exosome subunit
LRGRNILARDEQQVCRATMTDRLLHHVIITVFCKPHDDNALVLHGLDLLSPVPTAVLLQQEFEHDPERPKTMHYKMPNTELTVQKTESDDGPVIIYTLFFKKLTDVNVLARKLAKAMTPEERQAYSDDPSLLLDHEGKLSLRLDKELLMHDQFSLTEQGHCYQIKATIAAYPKTEEKILEGAARILSLSP